MSQDADKPHAEEEYTGEGRLRMSTLSSPYIDESLTCQDIMAAALDIKRKNKELGEKLKDIKEREEILYNEYKSLEEIRKIRTDSKGTIPLRSNDSQQAERTTDDFNFLIEEIETLKRELERERRHRSELGAAGNNPSPPLPSTYYCGPQISLQDALELVPRFDGRNIPILQFARACKRAREVVPPSAEGGLARLMRNRLTGHAYLAVEDEVHDTIDGLVNSLKRVFAPERSSSYYRGELIQIYMKPGEYILEYISRVKDLRTAIIESDKNMYHEEMEQINTFTLDCFFDGLPADFRIQLKLEGYKTLEDAFNKAITINKRIERDHERMHMTRSNSSFQRIDPFNRNTETFQRGNMPPDNINLRGRGEQGVTERTPPSSAFRQHQRNFHQYQQPTQVWSAGVPRQNNGEPSFTQKICNYCKKMGHLISECRKREYNNAFRPTQGNAQGPTVNMDANRDKPSTPMRPRTIIAKVETEESLPGPSNSLPSI